LVQRTQTVDLTQLSPEVLQRERIAGDSLLRFLHLFARNGFLGLFDQREHVTHSEDARGHPIWMKQLKCIKLLAHAQKLDRLAGHGPDRQHRSATSITFNLGENDTGQSDPLFELARHRDRVLPRHGICHQEHLMRLHGSLHCHQLPHQLIIDMETPTGIQDDKIVPLVPSPFYACLTDANDIPSGSLRLIDSMHIDVKITSQTRQLIAGCRTTWICSDQEHPFSLSLEIPPKLATGRRLSSTLEPHHHDNRWGIRSQSQASSLPAHHIPQLLPHNLHDLMTRG